MKNIFDDMTLARDHEEITLGDALDVKAGILLAVIAVLASLSGILFAIPHMLSSKGEIAQLISILCLGLACIFAVLTVIPRKYLLADIPRKYQEWGDAIRQHYPSDAEREAAIAAGIVQQAAKRIENNQKINKQKSGLLALSFWPALLALTIDVVTLLLLALLRVLS